MMSGTTGPLPLVSVVLCTYNGARFLEAQLNSLASQTVPLNRLVLRDDGSTDKTVSIVRDWSQNHRVPLVHVTQPVTRLGPARSFLTALAAGGPAQVHLLADQDDVWLPMKIERAIKALEAGPQQPRLYAARQLYVDRELHPLGTSPMPGSTEFSAAVYESQLTGCTMALNETLRLLVSRRVPQQALMHDWWIYMLASASGEIVFDEMPTMLYRQHGQNVIGVGPTGLVALKERVRRAAFAPGGQRRAQLMEFGETFADLLSDQQRALINSLTSTSSSCWRRWAIGTSVPISRRGWLNRLGTRLAIIRGRY